jgi:hypothetical protein
VIIASIVGGLGNQLFQYAMARRMAVRHGTEVLLDLSNFRTASKPSDGPILHDRRVRLFDFRIQAREASPAEISQLCDSYRGRYLVHRGVRFVRRKWPKLLWKNSHKVERGYRFQAEALSWPDDIYLTGFWQSEKYFADIAAQIRKEFVLVDEAITESARLKVQALRQKFGTVVSVHVRRGDLVYAYETLNQKHRVHGPPMSLDYFWRAMSQFQSSCCFLLFSDTPKDVEWCRQRFQANHFEFSDATSELWDFAAMQACDHHIISNSTFSWWAAWLNPTPGRRVIAPRQWSGTESKVEMHTDDLIPVSWTTL